MKYTIYHNPRCSKSRCALSWLNEHYNEVEVIDYINNPLRVDELREIGKKLNLPPSNWLRKEEEAYTTHIKGKLLSDEEIYQLMSQFPKLIQRPIVVWSGRAVVARPLEQLMDAIGNAN